MYNVLIVDDEPVIRFGLKASIDWEAEGLYLIGDYPNGEEALKAIESVQPDILITDIKMPLMDGITLMKHAIEKYPQLKVILVSSYNDFEYVREGLRFGAVDYILKPTLEPEDFLQLLRNTIKKLHQEKTIENKLSQIEDSHLLEERRRFENEIKRVILSEQEQLVIESFPKWLQNDFLFVYMVMNEVARVEMEHGLLYKSYILDEIQTLFYQKTRSGISFPIGDEKMLFLIEKYGQAFEIVESLSKQIEDETNLSFAFSYLTVSNVASIGQTFLQLQQACEVKFYLEKQFIFPVYDSKFINNEILDRTLPPLVLSYEPEFDSLVIKERMKEWESRNYSPLVVKKDASHILSQLFIKQLNGQIILDKCHELLMAESLSELKNKFHQSIVECNQLLIENKKSLSTDNEIIDKALDFIHQHYTEEMTLQRIGDYVHISRNYFSIIFKRYLDKNFIDYVIELRVNKAKELLAQTSLKIYEVAEKSGFRDVKYFSKVFKRLTGFSPVDYRSQNQE